MAMEMNTIYNVSAIVKLIPDEAKEKNLYGKVNAIIRGSKVGSPALRQAIAQVILESSEKFANEIYSAP